ncbi:MAG TPA: hypothetical protein VIK32_05760 [Candidatus Limnocylindrales bacterium]|jgi:hypothetical protein
MNRSTPAQGPSGHAPRKADPLTISPALADATALYEEYVELAKLAEIASAADEQASWRMTTPIPTRPFGLTLNSNPLGLVIQTEG